MPVQRDGTAYLPLHYGKPPELLYRKIVKLTGQICELINNTYGTEELIRRMSDPVWFHSLSLVTGFDWNSSGTTTTTLHALKEYTEKKDLDFFVGGGKGNHMREKRDDIGKRSSSFQNEHIPMRVIEETDLVAKIDQNMLQDSYDLYIHGIIADYSGNYAVIQQGLNVGEKMARRYHWSSFNIKEEREESRMGIGADSFSDQCLDLSSPESRDARNSIIEAIKEKPKIASEKQRTLDFYSGERVVNLAVHIPWKKIETIYELEPKNMKDLLLIPGAGKSTIRALCYISEVITGVRASYEDPVRYSYALGGKDGIPKPVCHEDYNMAIKFFDDLLKQTGKQSMEREKLLKRLSKESSAATSHYMIHR
ncbi:MAG: DUF763 domain-containing protein [Cuniculiplasma sp.]